MSQENMEQWSKGIAPIAVIMLSLNEGHNIKAVCENLLGWAQEIFLVDSYSQDDTVEIALQYGIHVVQHPFKDFGEQWNFALNTLPITAPWTMKLDPDERLSNELKINILKELEKNNCDAIKFKRRWWLMGKPLSISDTVLRIWKTGSCLFSDVAINEHPIIEGKINKVHGFLEHFDSPDLEHWVEKQNRYSTFEALLSYSKSKLTDTPRLLGTAIQRRMWIKKNFLNIPCRYFLLFLYFWLWKGLWKSGWHGYASARLWVIFFFIKECKYREMKSISRTFRKRCYGPGQPDQRVKQYN